MPSAAFSPPSSPIDRENPTRSPLFPFFFFFALLQSFSVFFDPRIFEFSNTRIFPLPGQSKKKKKINKHSKKLKNDREIGSKREALENLEGIRGSAPYCSKVRRTKSSREYRRILLLPLRSFPRDNGELDWNP